MNYLAMFFIGAFLCNAIPHLVSGLAGASFPTPFAKPRGVGHSSPLTNFIWSVVNLAAAGGLLYWRGVPAAVSDSTLAIVGGFIGMGIFASIHFGTARQSPDWK